MKPRLPLTIAALLLGALSIPSHGAVIVTGNYVSGTTVTGTLLAIDPPETSGDDGNIAGVGYTHVSGGTGTDGGGSRVFWEPDGTDSSTGWTGRWMNNGSVTFTFDVPDGAIINAVYHNYHNQGNQSTMVDYSYNEGSLVSTTRNHQTGDLSDIVIDWEDSGNTVRNVDFENIFSGPITVAGGDGFVVTMASTGIFSVDTMIIDYTIPEPSVALLGAFGSLLLLRRRR